MINIKTINGQYKQCKKITDTLFLEGKMKKLKIYKMVKKSGPISAFIYTTKFLNNNKNLIMCVTHALLGFYLLQYVQLV